MVLPPCGYRVLEAGTRPFPLILQGNCVKIAVRAEFIPPWPFGGQS